MSTNVGEYNMQQLIVGQSEELIKSYKGDA